MNNEQSKKISIQLSPENLFKLNTLSKQNRIDLSVIVNEALSAYLDQKIPTISKQDPIVHFAASIKEFDDLYKKLT